ncbi:MAG: tetratricopeptide repeat protein [Candidatus Omnitrophica bacterium]|nr:tetratricopeptide repeat protein [Candidatus Omnitrophota bacterium]
MDKTKEFNERVIGFLNSKKEGKSDVILFNLTKLIELDPENPEHYYNRGVAQGHTGNYELAINNYTKAIKLNPNDFEAYGNRGVAYDALGQQDKAIADLENTRIIPRAKLVKCWGIMLIEEIIFGR